LKIPELEVILALALVNHTKGGLSGLSINNGMIPWFRDRDFYRQGPLTRVLEVEVLCYHSSNRGRRPSKDLSQQPWRESAACGPLTGKPKSSAGRKVSRCGPSVQLTLGRVLPEREGLFVKAEV
jgi:hypothetical protein